MVECSPLRLVATSNVIAGANKRKMPTREGEWIESDLAFKGERRSKVTWFSLESESSRVGKSKNTIEIDWKG